MATSKFHFIFKEHLDVKHVNESQVLLCNSPQKDYNFYKEYFHVNPKSLCLVYNSKYLRLFSLQDLYLVFQK